MVAIVSTTLVSMSELGAWLQRELDRRDMRPADFARLAGVNPSLVTRWLHGTKPSPESCDLIADVLGVDLDLVLGLAGHRANVDELEPDDPVLQLRTLVGRIEWEHHQAELKMIRIQLEMLRSDDRERKSRLINIGRPGSNSDSIKESGAPLDNLGV